MQEAYQKSLQEQVYKDFYKTEMKKYSNQLFRRINNPFNTEEQ